MSTDNTVPIFVSVGSSVSSSDFNMIAIYPSQDIWFNRVRTALGMQLMKFALWIMGVHYEMEDKS